MRVLRFHFRPQPVGYPTDELLAKVDRDIAAAFEEPDGWARALYFQHLLRQKFKRAAILQGGDL